MSKLTHSNVDTMLAATKCGSVDDAGELYRCTVCGAENFVDAPGCPRGMPWTCNIEIVEPTTPPDRS